MAIPSESFYGRSRIGKRKRASWSRAAKDLENTAKIENWDKSGQPDPNRRCVMWFPQDGSLGYFSQMEAFEKADKCIASVKVFSREHPSLEPGKRRFIVSTLEYFWRKYFNMSNTEKCFYEVLQEGKPCKLYFDLEFTREGNDNLNGEYMLDVYIEIVCRSLKDNFGLRRTRCDCLELDSSTNTKFSRHLIFPNVIFADNICMGRFVHKLDDEIKVKAMQGDSKMNALLIDGSTFVDIGVYTRNRNFRMLFSSKVGKNIPFVVSSHSRYSPSTGKEHRHYWEASLIQNTSGTSGDVLKFGENPSRSDFFNRVKPRSKKLNNISSFPYHDIETFLLSGILRRGGVQGTIRRWYFSENSKTLAIDVQGNRYCENVGRQHKSNGIQIILNLREGIYYQKCYDPDCRAINFRGKMLSLPDYLFKTQPKSISPYEFQGQFGISPEDIFDDF